MSSRAGAPPTTTLTRLGVMSRSLRRTGVVLLAYCSLQSACADTSAYLEYGSLYNDNYNLAAEPAYEQSETVHALSAALVQSVPVSYKTTLLATGGFSHAWYRRFEDLSGNTFFLNGGVHHRWSYRNSFTGFIGGYRKLHENAQQDQDGWSVRANFIQKLGGRYWMSEQLFREQGTARTLPDNYRGHGLSVWLHRSFENRSMLSGAVTAAKKEYNDPLNRDFNNYQVLAEWMYPFQKRYYARIGAAYTLTGSDGNYEYRSVMGLFALGRQFSW